MSRIGLLGSGKLGEIIAGAIAAGKVPGCTLVGVMGRGMERAARLAERYGCTPCASTAELLALRPDYVVEAATPQALRDCALDFLAGGSHMVCLSMGPLADQAFYDAVVETAQAHHTKLYLASGVIGGLDIAATLAAMGELRGTVVKYKYPRDSGRCPPVLMDLPDQYEGPAREGYQLSPNHLNIAVAGALACGGLDHTRLRIAPITDAATDNFGLDLEGAYAGATIRIRQGGFAGHLGGTDLAAWSAVAALRRLTAPITF